MTKLLKLHHSRIDHVATPSELKYLIAVKMLGLQEPGFPVENRPKFKGLGFLSGKTHYNGSSSVPTWVRNHTADLEPLQTLVPKESLSNARS